MIDLIKSLLPKPGLDKRLVGIPDAIRPLTIGLATARVTFTRLLEIVICLVPCLNYYDTS